MENETVYQFARHEDESVCFSLREFKNRLYLDLRIFFQPKDSAELLPTKKGLTIVTDLIPELKKGIQMCEKALHAKKMGHKESIQPLQK